MRASELIDKEKLKATTAPQPYSKWDCCYTTLLFGAAITSLILALTTSYAEDRSRKGAP